MAGHSKFANIKHRKGAQDAKRAKLFTKLTREIIVASKMGGEDPDANYRLRTAIQAAKVQNVPKDRIEAAIKKGSSATNQDNYEEMRYEGYGPAGVAVIVETLTDNRNRTASDIRSLFTKAGGSLGETGSVNFLFERVGVIAYDAQNISEEKIVEAAIEAGASDCRVNGDQHEIITESVDLKKVSESISLQFGEPIVSKLNWLPNSYTDLDDQEKQEKIMRFLDNLEDNDDVQTVFSNHRFI